MLIDDYFLNISIIITSWALITYDKPFDFRNLLNASFENM